jgi:hypothetical protein
MHKHHRNTSEGGMQNYWILSPGEFIETTGNDRVKWASNCSSLSIAIGIMQVDVKTDCVYHFILWHLGPFLPYEASYRIAPNTATIIYHNTNETSKDAIPFNVTKETYSCDEKPAAAIQGHLTEDVTLQISLLRFLVVTRAVGLKYSPPTFSLLRAHPRTVLSYAD